MKKSKIKLKDVITSGFCLNYFLPPDYSSREFDGYYLETLLAFWGKRVHNKFIKWINGQTCGVHPKTNKSLIYAWDIDRFLLTLQRKKVLWD